MAEAALSVLLDQLSSILRDKVNQRFALVNGVEAEISTLKLNLQAIQAVVNDADKRQLTENAVKRWLDELKDASNDIDDVLDEWVTETNLGVHETDKVLLSCRNLFPCFRFGQLGLSRFDLGLKIRELNEKLEEISVRKDRYNLSTIGKEILVETEGPKFSTNSIIDVSEIYGRDNDRENLVRKLLCETSEEVKVRDFEIIPILGMGGIGKTTLAQMVYNDDRVKTRFEKRVWVCVSDPFDSFKIANSILEQISGQASNVVEVESLMRNVVDSISDKRFLLVLDDVWSEDYTKWEPLKRALKFGHFESKVLVTTRKEEVAVMMRGSLKNTVRLEKLSEEESWSLFRQVAFFGRDEEDLEELEGIGKEIATKCKGLPLAVKTLASHLRFKRTEDQWRFALNSEFWELEEAKKNLFSPLLLSYYDLSPVSRRCFSYCAVFPKDHLIEKDDLIQRWMSQGFFFSGEECSGEECFENLAARCFFQDFVLNNCDGAVTAFKMHDIVHDFAKFLTLNESSTVEVDRNSPDDSIAGGGVFARHLTLVLQPGSHIPISTLKNMKNLRTLTVSGSNIPNPTRDHFSNLRCLRTLTLSGCLITELPKNIGELIHLRYLNLSYNPRLIELPSTIGNLFNLQTLRLVSCRSVRELPCTIRKLINLRHLYIHGRILLEFLPKGIGKLNSLRTFNEFIVPLPAISNDRTCQLGDLKNLNNLRRLCITKLANAKDIAEADRARLKEKKDLTELTLTFRRNADRKVQEEVLEALCPNPNLRYLGISFYGGGRTISPSWLMSLTGLRWLVLRSCNSCETLPSLGKLPSLESLEISRFEKLKRVGPELLGTESGDSGRSLFPRLKELSFRYTPIKEWVGIKERRVGSCVKIMPRLRSLRLDNCVLLESLPDFLEDVAVQSLIIEDCPKLQQYSKRILEEWTNVSHIPNIKFLNRFYDDH